MTDSDPRDYFELAAMWAEMALVRGDQVAALSLWNPGADRDHGIPFNLAAGWIKTCLDLAEARGVSFEAVWDEAKRGI